MTSTSTSEGLGPALRTAFDVFETIRELARAWEDSDPDLLAAFMSAATSAADGRDALATAPALTTGTEAEPAVTAPGSGEDAQDAADVIAVLAAALVACLADAARHASIPEDRRACDYAAAAARQICQLMARPR
jgi:hypothetical protein